MENFEQIIESILDTIRWEKKIYNNYLSGDAIQAGTKLIKTMEKCSGEQLDDVLELLRKEIPCEHPYMAVWWYSVLLKAKKDAVVFKEFVRYIREKKNTFSKNTLDFLFYQLSYMYDANPSLYDDGTKLELWKLFLEIVEAFASEVTVPLEEIPESERDNSLVLAVIIHYIPHGCAPTITALDRCRILQKKMGKRVLMLNTAEALNSVGKIPIYETAYGNNLDYFKGARELDAMTWKDASIPYFQCPPSMPDVEIINLLLGQVRNMAPHRVILIGGSSILGNLINRIIPALTISTGFSDLAITGTKYQALGRKLTEEDIVKLNAIGYDKNHVIESTFTFDIKPQKEKVSRAELGITEDVFVLTMVSTRLDNEVTNEFLQMLEDALNEKMRIVFIGGFSSYEEKMKLFPDLRRKSVSLGSCEDVLSRLEICDLYVNPRRKGGGSSVVEAMYMGKPAVSIAYGDVAINAGEEFCVETYGEMAERILQYYQDKDFYGEMAEKAKKRAAVLLDTETAFREIMAEYERREANGRTAGEDAKI